jgi:hypothetical protein
MSLLTCFRANLTLVIFHVKIKCNFELDIYICLSSISCRTAELPISLLAYLPTYLSTYFAQLGGFGTVFGARFSAALSAQFSAALDAQVGA